MTNQEYIDFKSRVETYEKLNRTLKKYKEDLFNSSIFSQLSDKELNNLHNEINLRIKEIEYKIKKL